VAAIEQALGENAELKAVRGPLFDNSVPEKRMYTPMMSATVSFCGKYSPEKVICHTASSYLYLPCSVLAKRRSFFVAESTDADSERRSERIRTSCNIVGPSPCASLCTSEQTFNPRTDFEFSFSFLTTKRTTTSAPAGPGLTRIFPFFTPAMAFTSQFAGG